MEDTYPHLNALPLNFDGETDFLSAIFGGAYDEKKEEDTLVSVLNRYAADKNVGNNLLASMTGINKSEISRYLNGERRINRNTSA